MIKHIVFEGELPAWIGDAPRLAADGTLMSEEIILTGKDAENFAAEEMTFFAARRRNDKGNWVKRPKPPAPTAEEREAARLAARAARRAARREDMAAALREATPDLLAEMIENDHPPDWFKARRQEIREQFRDPEDD